MTALDDAFDSPAKQEDVLFHLPVTKSWIQQLVLALVLIGHSSFRGVQEILDAVFDYRQISLGTVHNIVTQAVAQARVVNDGQDLSTIRVGAGAPVEKRRRRRHQGHSDAAEEAFQPAARQNRWVGTHPQV